MSARSWLVATTLVAGLGLSAVAARWWASEEIVRVLQARDIHWTHRTDRFGDLVLQDVSGPGLRAERIDIALIPVPTVRISGVEVDLQVLRDRQEARTNPSADAGGPPVLPSVMLDDVRVLWGAQELVTGWSGTVLPLVQLSGPGGSVQRTVDGSWEGTLDHPIELGPLSGPATLGFRCSTDCTIRVDMPAAVLEHSFLASGPLPPTPLRAELDWSDGAVNGHLRLGAIEATVTGTMTTEPSHTAALDIEVPDTELTHLIDLFGDHIPEARRGRVVGTVGASGTFAWPSRDWTLTPRVSGLGAEGVLTDVDGLRNGTVSWTVLDADGLPRMRRTGRSLPDFVPFQAAGLLPAAVLAAEDSGFSSHNGVDLVAIQAALDDASREGFSGMRGGSTITQQLAKNLFLDTRERTLARKLRELMYALELDRVVPKERILELYLNVVELGDNLYGVGAAADAYFLKKPLRLTIEEAAFLAALLPAPRTRGERAWRGGRPPRARMTVIIDNMRDLNRITDWEAKDAKHRSLRLVPPP